ncbi:MAG TPA: FeoA family protein [Caulobacteraceae bacterium]|jgi:ferrous iron transport protein A|nr:FeoA family protein [Caulobacteraceae bacterium]
MAAPPVPALIPLGRGAKGFKGVVVQVGAPVASGRSSLDPAELERRLLEIGFVEGARVEILHVGLFGGDPLAIRLDDMRVALRRREADAVLVRVDEDAP